MEKYKRILDSIDLYTEEKILNSTSKYCFYDSNGYKYELSIRMIKTIYEEEVYLIYSL